LSIADRIKRRLPDPGPGMEKAFDSACPFDLFKAFLVGLNPFSFEDPRR
jgi:hypothetical protein